MQLTKNLWLVSRFYHLTALLIILVPTVVEGQKPDSKDDGGFIPLFNGRDLSGWQLVNTADSTWSVQDGMLICSGKPIGEIRTTRMYQNFILEVEWRHMKPRGNAGIFVWADDITAKGVPFHRSIEVQVLENAYGNSRGHTTHGDIFPIHGAKMTPVNGRGGSRAFPTENRSRPSPQWNQYRIECRDGNIALAVNGKVVTRGKDASPRKGYICIESEGGVVHYRNMRIKELPKTPVRPQDVAIADRGYRSIYNGVNLDNWEPLSGTWQANDWRLVQTAASGKLVSRKGFSFKKAIIDFRTTEPLPEIELGGYTIDLSNFQDGTAEGKGWNRLEVLVDQKLVKLNGRKILTELPATIQGQFRVVSKGPTEFSNIYVAE